MEIFSIIEIVSVIAEANYTAYSIVERERGVAVLFSEYLVTVKGVGVLDTAYGLARSYSCGIVGVGIIAVRSETSYISPSEVLAPIRRRIAECIVADTLTVVRSKLILPACACIGVGLLYYFAKVLSI